MKTRTTKKAPAKKEHGQTESEVHSNELPPSSTNPPLVFVLPENQLPDARIATLPNPANNVPNRYYVCPERGVYEFTRVTAPKKTPRSWLLAPDPTKLEPQGQTAGTGVDGKKVDTGVPKSQAIEQPDLFLATPLDPLFLLLPALMTDTSTGDTHKQLFLSIDDHLDTLAESSKHLKHVLQNEKLRRTMEQRAENVCDSVLAGEDKMYRLSDDKLAKEVISKAQRMAERGLPASMEHKFVQEVLQTPVTIAKQEAAADPDQTPDSLEASNIAVDSASSAVDSQSSSSVSGTAADSQASQVSVPSIYTEATSFSSDNSARAEPEAAHQDIVHLLRIRTALDFLLSAYISTALRMRLQAIFTGSSSPVSFAPLEAHLARLISLRKEAQALRSLSDNISRKRSHMDDDEAEEARAEKKRKKEEEEAKKKNQSRGVKQLSKVNTTGMAKMSSFFSKVPAKKAKG